MDTYVIEVNRIVHDQLNGTVHIEAASRAAALVKAQQLLDAGQINMKEYVGDADAPTFEIVSGPEDEKPLPFTEDDVKYAVELADQFITDWEEDEGKDAESRAECEDARRRFNAVEPLLRASFEMLADLRSAAAYSDALSAEPDPRAPDGDDFNEVMSYVDGAIAAYEKGGA